MSDLGAVYGVYNDCPVLFDLFRVLMSLTYVPTCSVHDSLLINVMWPMLCVHVHVHVHLHLQLVHVRISGSNSCTCAH